MQNHGILADGRFLLPYPGFDIMPELDWPDLDAMDAAIDSPVHEQDSVLDERNFIDPSRTGYAVTVRHTLVDGTPPRDPVKLITVLRRSPNVSVAALGEALTGPYADAVRHGRPLRHEVLLALPDREARPSFAAQAVDMLWFGSAEDALAWHASETAYQAAWHLAGVTFGAERLIARPVRIV